MVDRGERIVTTQRRVAPTVQPGDHVPAHLLREDQAGRRAADRDRRRDIGGVRVEKGCHRGLVGESIGELVEERRDLFVGDVAQSGESGASGGHGTLRDIELRLGNVKQVPGIGDRDQAVARCECRRQLIADGDEVVAVDQDDLPRFESFQGLRPAHRMKRR